MENNQDFKIDFLKLLPNVDLLEEELKIEFSRNSILKKVPKGEIIAFEGDECHYLPFVLEGIIRIYKLAESGREITLYRLGKGESCILTASCLMSKKSFPATACSETDIQILLIPSEVFRNWVSKYQYWNTYLYSLLSERLAEVIMMIEEVAFKRMDIRLAEYLLGNVDKTDHMIITHKTIASELGSSREVVSRLLKNFEQENWIKLFRNKIKLTDKNKLSQLIKPLP